MTLDFHFKVLLVIDEVVNISMIESVKPYSTKRVKRLEVLLVDRLASFE